MWRLFFIAGLLAAFPTTIRAQEVGQNWQSCRGEPAASAPVLRDCRPVEGVIDPQGRELWLRAVVRRPAGDAPTALYIVGVASSEVWLNDQELGANGQPGGSSSTETPGRYEAAIPIPERLWRAPDNVVVIHMSTFHGQVRLDGPVAAIVVAPWPWPSRAVPLAVTFVVAGALFAAAFGFGVIHSLRRTRSSLTLAALAGVSGFQAVLESLRTLVPYAYPVHGWRLIGIWLLTAAFALLLAMEKTGGERAGLNAALREVTSEGGEVILPGEWAKAKELIAAGTKINYEGASGAIEFDDKGDVPGSYDEVTIENGAIVVVGPAQ